MSKINDIQKAIKELEGGSFQKLFDAYLFKKYNFENIHTLGVQEGTNKTTKGTPDSFVIDETGKYILIMYGTVEKASFSKIKEDILSCFKKDKLEIDEDKIAKIICAYSSTNLHVEQIEELKNLVLGVEIDLIGLSTISHDLLVNYPFLAKEFLNIPIDTNQIFSRDEFIKAYDKNGMNAPINMEFYYREQEQEKLSASIIDSKITLVTGASGVGKTRLVVEVCKQFEKNGWNILCIKNNGEMLYNDMKYYLSDAGRYILFIDDANQTTSLEYVLDFINSLPNNIDVRIVMTVRDYAKPRVKAIVCSYMLPAEITVNVLKDDEIKEILQRNLGILNEDFLNRIAQIAKGNARLAILAGKISITNGYLSIRNATDIFANYYGRIIKQEDIKKESINTLFVVSLLGAIRYKESIIAQRILELVNINTECFISLCHDLNEKEIIDLYQDEVAKVSDQSLGNYIIYHVLIEKKTISISQLLQIGFPLFKNKLVYALNTLMKLFYSEDLKKYITEQVNISWDVAGESQQEEYITCFHGLNEEKSLNMLKKKIDNMHSTQTDLSAFDIEGKKNYNDIKCDEISILSSFKYSEYFDDVVELMMLFFNKRPDLIMDFYFAFSDRMAFDTFSYRFNYEKEYKLIKEIWRYADKGQNYNVTILFLHVVKEMLKCSFRRIESGENSRTFSMYQLQIVFTDESKKLRLFIWEILSEIYSVKSYTKMISDIASDCYVDGLDAEDAKLFFEFDLQCIKKLFFDRWEHLSFEQCKMLSRLENYSQGVEIEDKDFFARYMENENFMIYHTLIREHINKKTWEWNENERKKQIEEMIRGYEDCDYIRLFKICQMCEKNSNEEWWLKSGLDIVFSSLENRPKLYYSVIKLYLQCEAPYGDSAEKIISVLLKNIGFDKTKNLIDENEFPYKRYWLSTLWEIAPKELVNEEVTRMFLEFVRKEACFENPCFPTIRCLDRYRMFDYAIVKKVSEVVIESSQDKGYIAAKFLNYVFQSSDVELVKDLFVDNYELLEKMYFLAFIDGFDYNGELLLELVKNNDCFWNEFTMKFAGEVRKITHGRNIFENIWKLDNYMFLIQIAYDNMMGDYYGFRAESIGKQIFAYDNKTLECIRQRKRNWIKKYIKNNLENKQNLDMIFNIIATVLPEERKKFIIELTNYTKDMDVLKDIPLFPCVVSWSNSEVPIIDRKIDFLNDLLSELKGIDYIEYRVYLKEKINSYENYKQQVLIKEYLRDADIA